MALTIESSPDSIALVKNEVKYKFSSDNYYSVAGVKAKRIIDISDGGGAGGPDDNEDFTISWTDADGIAQSFTYTFKTAPVGDYEILKFQGLGTFMDDWVNNNLLPKLFDNYYLNRDYYVVLVSSDASNAQISIEAKESGSAFSIAGAEAVTDFAFTDTAGITAVARENFSIWIDLFLEQEYLSEEFDIIKQFSLKLNEDMEAQLFLEKYLKPFCSFDLPSYFQDVVSYSANLIKRFYIFCTEAYGDPAAAISWIKNPADFDDFKLILFAGNGFVKFWGNTFVADYCTAKDGKKFLTNLLSGNFVQTSHHLFLSFFITSSSAFVVYCKMYFSDETDSTHSFNGSASKQNYIATIPASIDQIDPAIPGGYDKTDIISYEIYVKDHSSSVNKTETFTFKVARKRYEYSKQFIFVNSLGGIDSLWCTGKSAKESEFIFSELEKIADNENAGSSSIIRASQVKNKSGFQNIFKASTGFKNKVYIDYLQEFFNSEAVFEVIDSKYVEVLITSKEQLIFEDDVHLYALGFEYKFGFINSAYSSIL